jgi:hypothetical protein
VLPPVAPNTKVEPPDFVNAPSPEITPVIVWVVPDEVFENVNVLALGVIAIMPPYEAEVPSVPDTVRLPSLIVVLPEYVFVPESVSNAAPDFVNAAAVVASNTTPEITPAAAAFTVAPTEPIATVPDNVPAAAKFTAPADDTPVPAIDNGSATVEVVAISSVAPDTTDVEPRTGVAAVDSPNAFASVIFTVPAEIVVSPV